MSDEPCEQGIHWIECDGCRMCGRSWNEAVEHSRLVSAREAAKEANDFIDNWIGAQAKGTGSGGSGR